jgi:hypothetical protein
MRPSWRSNYIGYLFKGDGGKGNEVISVFEFSNLGGKVLLMFIVRGL